MVFSFDWCIPPPRCMPALGGSFFVKRPISIQIWFFLSITLVWGGWLCCIFLILPTCSSLRPICSCSITPEEHFLFEMCELILFHCTIPFKSNCLGGEQVTFTLNFSKGSGTIIMQYFNFLRLGRQVIGDGGVYRCVFFFFLLH